ncbi:hypothetical protein LUZ60_010090 [Juncus effusus]|nr:hypothetical protein LUZ60_010090 [Juncus effusus]
MKTSQDSPVAEPANEIQGNEAQDLSVASNDNRKVSREDIELVQNLIERCLQLYMNKSEVVRTLSTRARIEPGFTTLVWQKLEEENAEFFTAYYIRLKLKKQIIMFNHLLDHQYHLMKYPIPPKVPLASLQNGIHPMPPVNNHMPMGYPVLQQPPHPHPPPQLLPGPHASELSSCHLVNGIPAPSNYHHHHPIRLNSDNNNMMIDNNNNNNNNEAAAAAVTAPASASASASAAAAALSDLAMSPSSAASSNHFPFGSADIMGMDAGFGPDSAGLHLGDGGVGGSRDPIQTLGLWNFSLTDLTADLTSLGDLGALENYTGTPFLPSDSDILLDSPDHDDIVEEYFADAITGPAQSDEEKS